MSDVVALFLGNLQGGGAERAGLHFAEALLREGFQVDLIVAQLEGAYLNQIPSGVKLIQLHSRNFFGKIIRLRKYLRENRPRVLFSILTRENVIALIAKQFLRKKPTIFISERSVFTQVYKTLTLKHKLFIKPVLRYLYPKADEIIAVSCGVAEDLSHALKIPMERISVIYNPIFLSEITLKSRQAPAHPWCFLKDKPLILAVGRLVAPKDFLTLIEAFAKVNREKPSRLLILGEGEERAELEKKIKDLNLSSKINLPGFVENPFAYMSRASVLVLSSHFEGFSNVLVEAMACGTPVVSTDCPSGPREILRDGEFGPLVPLRSPEALAQAILDVLGHPLDKEVLRKRVEEFSYERVIKKFVNLMEA